MPVRKNATRWLFLPAVLILFGCTRSADEEVSSPAHPESAASDADLSLARRFDERAQEWLSENDVPSVAVAYVRDGKVRWTRVYGEQAEGVPATGKTLYNVASLAKPISAEVILRLASAGYLSLDEPLSRYWIDPDIEHDPRHRKLNLRLALSHQTGFRNWRYETGGVLRFETDPGARYGYSGEGYEYARRFTERKLGKSWESLANEAVFAPVGMGDTAYTAQPWFANRTAIPYEAGGQEAKGHWLEPQVRETPNAADDVFTTIGDYAAFLVSVMKREHLEPGIAAQRDTIQVESPGATADCDAGHVTYCPERDGAGLGWEIIEFSDEKVLLHTGGDAGTQTLAFYFAGRRDGAVMFTNGDRGFQVMIPATALLFEGTDFAAFAMSKR